MLIILFIAFLLIQFIVTELNTSKESKWKRLTPIIVASAIILLPLLFFNFIKPVGYIQKYDHRKEFFIEDKNHYSFLKELRKEMKQRDFSFPELKDYVDQYMIYGGNYCIHLLEEQLTDDTLNELLIDNYILLKCDTTELSLYYPKLQDYKSPYIPYIAGLKALNENDSSCLSLFDASISKVPSFDANYRAKAEYYMFSDYRAYLSYISDSKVRPHIPAEERRIHHFMNGNIIEYVIAMFDLELDKWQWLPTLIALIISGAWLFFIWKLDIFRPEKWAHVIAVFILGCLSTYLCNPIYDYFMIYWNAGINGQPVNDFLFSVGVIGFAEETVKFLPWILYGLLTKRFKEPYDYLVYAGTAALGFAFIENVMYLDNLFNITIRTLVSVTSHMFDASIIAYAFILRRYKYQDKPWKNLIPVIGFLLACLSHGFYDFWLISPAVSDYSYVTILFFIISLFIWFHFKNNAISHSPYFNQSIKINNRSLQRIMTFALLTIFMLEYSVVSNKYGCETGNYIFFHKSATLGLFLILFNFQIEQLRPEYKRWKKVKWRFPKVVSSLFSLAEADSEEMGDYSGMTITLYAPKTNQFLGSAFPRTGKLVRQITIQGDSNWYLFEFNQSFQYGGFVPDLAIIRAKNKGEHLGMDKVEVLYLFIPSMELLTAKELHSSQFRVGGRVYARIQGLQSVDY